MCAGEATPLIMIANSTPMWGLLAHMLSDVLHERPPLLFVGEFISGGLMVVGLHAQWLYSLAP